MGENGGGNSAPKRGREIVIESDYNRCFGCGQMNPTGLRLTFYETDDGAEVECVVAQEFSGPPGIAHGGIQATILDETMCVTAYAKAGVQVVTGEMTVRYLWPVPTATPIRARGRIVERKDHSFFIEGAIHLAATGEELTRARGRFFAQEA